MMILSGWTHQLTLETKKPTSDPSWSKIAAAVNEIDAAKVDAFVVLDRSDGEYIQAYSCAGEYAVERSGTDKETGATSQFVAGIPPVLPETVCIGTRLKHVTVLRGEVLTKQQTLALFRAFYEQEPLPQEFAWRDIGAQVRKLGENMPETKGARHSNGGRGTRRL